jgi:hypothetical protein
MEQFSDFPCLFVVDWNDVTEEFLHMKYDEIMKRSYNLDRLRVSYWKKEIATSF